jgi:hypothetical protein
MNRSCDESTHNEVTRDESTLRLINPVMNQLCNELTLHRVDPAMNRPMMNRPCNESTRDESTHDESTLR